MRAVVQRVTQGSVTIDGEMVASIGPGVVVLLGVGEDDTREDAKYIAQKIVGLRIFNDENDKMNLDLKDVGGSVLAVSQFTLHGDARRGRRPSYSQAAPPALAEELYLVCVEEMRQLGVSVATGVFQAMMQVEIHNDGPVTILLDSKRVF
ncbi:MAG TPA: D-tyrosyl-tRNA(Tyr) deacylase [Firmicutes bacterium]|jgi:D-tyrosyl-tRNA(Tyr) deacylase|nr:D-tyrosyl-tRNA(Tyr) deacylase [Bacillota bacterium]